MAGHVKDSWQPLTLLRALLCHEVLERLAGSAGLGQQQCSAWALTRAQGSTGMPLKIAGSQREE